MSGLNEFQQKAVNHVDGPALIIASPGSGKTTVLINRIEKLISSGVDPSEIFACTFTKKAAQEMRDRLDKKIGIEAEYVRISTLHSYCYTVLKRFYSRKAQGGKKIKVVDSSRVWSELRKAITENNCKLKDIKNVLQDIAQYKLNDIDPDQYFNNLDEDVKSPTFPYDITNHKQLCFHFLYKKYQNLLKRTDSIDLTDMLFLTNRILSNPANESFLKLIQEQFRYVLVDESQDTNLVSFEIYKMLVAQHNNLMFIGDQRQAIFGFQGADPTIIDTFVSQFKPVIYELPLNYRSTKTIVDLSNKLIRNSELVGSLSPALANKGEGENIEVLTSDCEIYESINIADKVKELLSYGHQPKDITVLYRVHSQAIPLLDQFITNKIPYKIFVKVNAFDKSELKLLINYVKAIVKPEECKYADFYNIVNKPVRYAKRITFEAIQDHADMRDMSFYESMLNADSFIKDNNQKNVVDKFVKELARARRWFLKNQANTFGFLTYILEDMRVRQYLESPDGINSGVTGESGDDRELDLELIMSMANKYEHVEDFLSFVTSVNQSKKESKDDDEEEVEEEEDAVKVMSIHRSKGLEFPTVILMGMCSRLLPYYRSVEENNIDEERRLAYVAVTRAESKLYVSTIKGRVGRFKVNDSIFLDELGLKHQTNYVQQ